MMGLQQIELSGQRGKPLATCTDCGAGVIAATASKFVNERCARNEWSCDSCGSEFETFACLSKAQSPGSAAMNAASAARV